jgi:hypothetical protein
MNIWFRRFLVVLTVGGGFLGAVISADTLFAAKNTPVFAYAMIALVIALYTYGIFAGIRLSEDASHYGHVLFFYAVQVPFFSSPILLYRFTCGLHATIWVVGFSVGWMFRLGSDFQLAILQPNSWGGGVNLFAAAILFALVVHFFSEEDKAPAPGPPVTDPPPPQRLFTHCLHQCLTSR